METNLRAETSRENGRMSRGPTSPVGKAHMRLNALKTGLFSLETVITSAGESQADFNQLRAAVWEQFEPQDATTGMLANEVVTSYWRLLRVRRCEAGEIIKRRNTATVRLYFDRLANVDALKRLFLRHRVARNTYRTASDQFEPAVITASIEDVRAELRASAAGLEFLTDIIKEVEAAVKARGYLTPMNEVQLIDACGVEDGFANSCVGLNKVAKVEMERADKDSKTSTFDVNKKIMLMRFASEIRFRMNMCDVLERLESEEDEAHLKTLVLPTEEVANRIHRAEAALERSYYKALDRLLAIPKPRHHNRKI
jgi:hypothetical protein